MVLAGSVGAIAAIAFALRILPNTSSTTAALALLLVILAAATLARLRIAIVVSLTAMLTLNLMFLPPLGTLTIADPQNWVALFAFLIVAVIASNLSAAAQARAREAIARRNEVTRLFDLTRDVLLTTETAGAIDALARYAARRFELRQLAVCLPSERGWHLFQGGEKEMSIPHDVLNIALTGGHIKAGELHALSIVPLRHGTRPIGLLATVAPALGIGTLDALAGVVAIAIERTQFMLDRDAAALVKQKADLAAALLAALSHDLRTPLTAIGVAIENLKGELPVPSRREQATAAMAELERLTRLFQDILDMARIDAAAVPVERQWITAADVVDVAVAHARHALGSHPLDVDADADLEVEVDPRLASLALSHVIENAARYSPADRPIALRARVEDDGLHVSVTDQGPGLDPAELEHLFERFYRGRAGKQTPGGTGMGLSIARGLLNAAGGRIWAENVPGAGARFFVTVAGAVRPVTVSS